MIAQMENRFPPRLRQLQCLPVARENDECIFCIHPSHSSFHSGDIRIEKN